MGRYVGRDFIKGVPVNPKEKDNIIHFLKEKIKLYGEEKNVGLEKIQCCNEFYKVKQKVIDTKRKIA
jgi:hypothetical protein